MVELSISNESLIINVKGADKLWAFKGSMEIPLGHITGIRSDPAIAHSWWHGLKMPGTSIPGVITAGTFYRSGKRVFWDVHNPDRTIVLELNHEDYNELIVEVADPALAIQMVKSALPKENLP